MKLYALNIKNTKVEFCNKVLTNITGYKKRIYLKNKDNKRAYQRVWSDILLRVILIKDLGIRNEDIVLEFNRYGKPFLSGYPHVFFNISHSKDWVVVAISYTDVGIDIEYRKEVSPYLIKKSISDEDYISKEKINKNDFFDLWTLKEAYLKAKGIGLMKPLHSIEIECKGFIYKEKQEENFFLKLFNISSDYSLSVCVKSRDRFPREVQKVKGERLIEDFKRIIQI